VLILKLRIDHKFCHDLGANFFLTFWPPNIYGLNHSLSVSDGIFLASSVVFVERNSQPRCSVCVSMSCCCE